MHITPRGSERIIADLRWAKGGAIVHSDPFSRLYYLRSGKGELRQGRIVTPLLPGRLYLIPAYSAYRYRCLANMDLSYAHLSIRLGSLGHLHQFVNWPLMIKPLDLKWVEERMDIAIAPKDSVSWLMRDGALRQLLALFEEASESETQLPEMARRFTPVLRHVEENLSQRIYLADMASLVHLQPNYFSDLFRKHFGEAPSRYVQRRRIETAAERLVISDVSLKEVAADLGFTDEFHFSRTFKSFMGIAPSRYRTSILRNG